ncbi:RNA polymerase sigma factor [Nocardioides marmoraquaticus]
MVPPELPPQVPVGDPHDRAGAVDLPPLPEDPAALQFASDNVLARKAGLGDREAFELLFRRHVEATHRFALRMLDSDRALADEAVQEAWVKAWRRLPSFEGRSAFTTWMFSITSRQALDLRRKRRPVAVDDQILEPLVHSRGPVRSDGDPHQAAVAGQLWETLLVALSELPWRQRAAWLLRELEGMSYGEIADVLDTTDTVVRGQLHRARRTLATRMEQWR